MNYISTARPVPAATATTEIHKSVSAFPTKPRHRRHAQSQSHQVLRSRRHFERRSDPRPRADRHVGAAFHLQNWRFIAVRTPEAKARLRPIAWDQPAITDAAVTFIIIGRLADASTVLRASPRWWKPVSCLRIVVAEWERPARGSV